MASKGDVSHAETVCSVRVSPDVVEADAELTLQLEVSCIPACDLRGHALFIKDDTGADVARVELTGFDGAANQSHEFMVNAPATPGTYAWTAVSPAVSKQGVSCPETIAAIAFTVKPHAANALVWGIPSAIVAGERFSIKVGIKCAHDCSLAGADVELWSHEGTPIGRGKLSDDRWPGTSALYVADVQLDAPAEEGLYTWTAKGPSSMLGEGSSTLKIPHEEASASFEVRVVTKPECLVTVEAVDQASQAPVSGARVVMHPYKAVTDERGVAHVRVTRGAYQLFVSQTSYVTFGLPVEVVADMTARAELLLEPVRERN
jgi:hypothetical protein